MREQTITKIVAQKINRIINSYTKYEKNDNDNKRQEIEKEKNIIIVVKQLADPVPFQYPDLFAIFFEWKSE